MLYADTWIAAFEKEGVDVKSYLDAAVKQPSLFGMLASTINTKIRTVSETFSEQGLDAKHYVNAALKHPNLFYQNPDTIIDHMYRIFELYDEGKIELASRYGVPRFEGDHSPIINYLLRFPMKLSFDNSNFELRSVYGDIREAARKTADEVTRVNVLWETRGAVEKKVAEHYGHLDVNEPVLPSNAPLYALVQRGLFKNGLKTGPV